MNQEQLSDALNYLDDDIIIETDMVRQRPKKPLKTIYKWLSFAACFMFVFIGSLVAGQFITNKTANDEAAMGSIIGDSFENIIPESDVTDFADSSEFSEKSNFLCQNDIVIFKGTITSITSGASPCISIQIEKVYRGSCQENDVITISAPTLSEESDSFSNENTNIVANLTVGTTGIFMPLESSKNTYEFLNGFQYVFYETEKGIVFSRDTYASISDAETLDEIEDYILKMLKTE